MKQYIVDTCIWIEYFHRNPSVLTAMAAHRREDLFASEITVAEMLYGALHSQNPAKHRREVDFLRSLYPVMPISRAIEEYAVIRDALTRQGIRIGDFDLFIGATALHYGLTVVTDNVRHFQLMPGVKVVNWVER